MDAEAGEAWGRPLRYPCGDLGCGPCPLPSPGPGLRDAPRPHLLRITPGHLLPTPLQTEKDLSPLNIQTFFVFIFFQGRSNIFQMRQNRDRSEAFSAGACVSAGRGFRLGLRAFLLTALFSLFLPRNFEFCFRSGFLGCSLSLPPSSALGIPPSVSPYASPDLSLPLSPWPVPPSSLSLRSLFVRLQVPGPKQTFRSSQRIGDCRTTRGVAVPRVRPRPPRPGDPPSSAPPAVPARTWSPRPAPLSPLPSTRAWAGAGVLNGVSRAPRAGPRAPQWPGWLPITRRSRPRPRPAPPVLQSGSRPRLPGSDRPWVGGLQPRRSPPSNLRISVSRSPDLCLSRVRLAVGQSLGRGGILRNLPL